MMIRLRQAKALILVKKVVRGFMDDDCPFLASAISYYALFSLFPLLLGLISILGFVLGTSRVKEESMNVVQAYLPGAVDLVRENVEQVVAARQTIGVVATLGFIWSAASVFSATRKSLNVVWNVQRSRPLLHQKALELGMVLATGFFLLLSISLSAFLRIIRALQVPMYGFRPLDHALLWTALEMLLPLVFTFCIFLLVYRVVPNAHVAWREAATGALVAAPLFEIAKYGFVLYVDSLGRYELVYGSVGAVISLLMWAYVSGIVLLVGAEVASRYGQIRGNSTLEQEPVSATRSSVRM